MKRSNRIVAALLAVLMLMSCRIVTAFASAKDVTDDGYHFGDVWQAQARKLNRRTLKMDVKVIGGTKFCLNYNLGANQNKLCCDCENKAECEVIYALGPEDLHYRFDSNGNMLTLSFEKDGLSTYCTAVPTDSAIVGNVVKGVLWYESADGAHKTGEYPFEFTISASADAGEQTDTVSDRTDLVNATVKTTLPVTFDATIAPNGSYTAAIATSDLAENPGPSGYTDKPTALTPTFTSGDGLLTFSIRLGASPISEETTYELLTVTPTAAALALAQVTTATGTVTVYRGGEVEIPFSITIDPALMKLPDYTETASDRTDYADYGDGWEVTPKTVEATIDAREKYTLALATSYWANTSYTGYNATPIALPATFTTGEGLLSFSVHVAPGPIWGGAECELLTITPTNAAYSLTTETTATGYIDIYWRGWVQMPFSVTITPAGGAAPEPVTTVSEREDLASADSVTGFSATFDATVDPQGTYTAAIATSDVAENPGPSGYTDKPTVLTPTFTSGDGLLTFSVRMGASPISEGTTYELLTVTPTAAAAVLKNDVTATGTVRVYRGGEVDIPFSITIHPSTAPTLVDTWAVAEAFNATSVAMMPVTPMTYTMDVLDTSTDVMMVLHSSYHFMNCKCGTTWSGDPAAACPELMDLANLHVRYTKNGDYLNLLFSKQEKWSQDCIYITMMPTQAGVAAVSDGRMPTVEGVIYYESADGAHGSYEHPFVFTLKKHQVPVRPSSPFGASSASPARGGLESIPEMAGQVDSIINNQRANAGCVPVHAVLDPNNQYRGLVMTTAMIPYTVCETDGIDECPERKNLSVNDMKIEFTRGGDLVKSAAFAIANFDGWGDCIYMTLTFTDEAANAEPKTVLEGRLYFERGSHRTKSIEFFFSLFEQSDERTFAESLAKNMSSLKTIDGMVYDVDTMVANARLGKKNAPYKGIISAKNQYRGMLMTMGLIPYVPCEKDGVNCKESGNFTVEDLKVRFINGEGVADVVFEKWNYDGWGDCIYMYVLPTEAAAQAEEGTKIEFEVYFERNGHRSKGLPFNFMLQSLPFIDISPSDWSYRAISYAYKNNLMRGTSEDRVSPKMPLSRAMLVTVLWRIAGEPEAQNQTSFNDVPADSYYAKAVAWASENGIVAGNNGNFMPDVAATREQLAAIFFRFASKQDKAVSTRTDLAQIAAWDEQPPLLDITMRSDISYTAALCTDYWANTSHSGYGSSMKKVDVNFDAGNDLVEFTIGIQKGGPIWGVDCEVLTVTPTAAAKALTEEKTVTGTIHIYRGGWVDMPFSITLRPLAGYETNSDVIESFSDADKISHWAADAVAWAKTSGLLNGKDGARMVPQGKTTREEFAMVLSRFGG